MSYTAFEVEPGSCNEQVEIICKHLTDNGSFSQNSQIEQSDVDRLITMTYYEITAMLAEYGYSHEQTDEKIVGLLEYYNALGASARTELSLATTGFAATENSRHRFLWKQYYDGLRSILSGGALLNLGAVELSSSVGDANAATAGGISISDKKTIESDSDATRYSFTRRMLDNPNYDTQGVIHDRNSTTEVP